MICSNCLVSPICQNVCEDMRNLIRRSAENDEVMLGIPTRKMDFPCKCNDTFYTPGYRGEFFGIQFIMCSKCRTVYANRECK